MASVALPLQQSPNKGTNPVIFADVPDMSVVRAGNTYYMSSTTMHLSPGVPIMKSEDLVNWFRKDKNGNFLWPGFKDNMRVLKWITERVSSNVSAIESPIGWMPRYADMDWTGLNFTKQQFREIMQVDREAWKAELLSHEELFARMYDRLPKEFIFMRELLLSAL